MKVRREVEDGLRVQFAGKQLLHEVLAGRHDGAGVRHGVIQRLLEDGLELLLQDSRQVAVCATQFPPKPPVLVL